MLDRSWKALEALFADIEDNSLLEEDPVGEFLSRKDDGTYQLEDEEVQEEAQTTLESQETGAEKEDTEKLGPAPMGLEQSPEGQELKAEDMGPTFFDEDEERAVGLNDEMKEVAATTDEILQSLEGEPEETAAVIDESLGALEVEGERFEMTEAAYDDSKVVDTERPDTEVPTSGDIDPQIFEVEEPEVESAELSDDELQADEETEHKGEVSFSSKSEEAQEDEDVDGLLEVFKSEQLEESPISVLSKELEDADIYSLLEETKRVADKFRKSS
jgi:hypothetical protein